MRPGQIMEQFTDEEFVHLVAYQNLYGPITPRRWDIVLARLGMDVVTPHMKKGRTPRLRDHLMIWSRADRPSRTGREILNIVKGIQAQYDQDEQDNAKTGKRGWRRKREG